MTLTSAKKEKTAPNYKLHIFTLCSFVVAQPLLDLVSKNVELLIASQTGISSLVVLILFLSIGIPSLLVLPGQVARLISIGLSNKIFLVTIGFLISLLFLLVFKKIISGSGSILIPLAILSATGFCYTYVKYQFPGMICSYSSPAIIFFPVLFLINPAVSRAVFDFNDSIPSSFATAKSIPVVMLIFDELPIISLLAESASIDEIRYPNFAALAANSHWFRNAQSISGATTEAVPAILSGIARKQVLPIAADYPQNLFTLLKSSHQLHVTEIVTSLCPESVCGSPQGSPTQSTPDNLESFLSDLSIIYLHILLPEDFTARLPVVNQSWSGFSRNNFVNTEEDGFVIDWSAIGKTRYSNFSNFVESIATSDTPPLYFYHALLPHTPWEYLPSGKLYSMTGHSTPGLGITNDRWGENDTLVAQGYQRHLLQIGFVDKLLGDLVEKLKSVGLYEQSLLVIVSDHGTNFWPESNRRETLDSGRERDVLGVSLFIKLPYQEIGVIHDESVSTLDILPAIASVLGVSQWLQADRRNILDQSLPTFTGIDSLPNPYLNNITLRRKLQLFGSGNSKELFHVGPFLQLLGQSQNDFEIHSTNNLNYEFNQQGYLREVDLSAPFIPARLTGKIHGIDISIDLAVSLNNKIVATTRSYVESENNLFSVMLPESEFVNGRNRIELFRIHLEDAMIVSLERIRNPRSNDYHYVSFNNHSFISDDNGNVIALNSNRVTGFVDSIVVEDDIVLINGWAADNQDLKPADFILLDIDGELILLGDLNFRREDVARSLGSADLTVSGYNFKIPASRFGEFDPLSAGIIAVSAQQATLLKSSATNKNYAHNLAENLQHSNVIYEFVSSGETGEVSITDQSDTMINLVTRKTSGFVDSLELQNEHVIIRGWAADLQQFKPMEFLLLDIDNELLYLGAPGLERKDVARVYDNPGVLKSGYVFTIALSRFSGQYPMKIRVIGVNGGQATVLKSRFDLGERIEQFFPD